MSMEVYGSGQVKSLAQQSSLACKTRRRSLERYVAVIVSKTFEDYSSYNLCLRQWVHPTKRLTEPNRSRTQRCVYYYRYRPIGTRTMY